MEITGILKAKFDTQKVSDRFSKREFVLTTDPTTDYPQHVSFQLVNDKCGILDQFETGSELKVVFNLRGREWDGPQGIKYFNTLEAWRIELASGAEKPKKQDSAKTNAQPSKGTQQNTSSSPDNDDMPF